MGHLAYPANQESPIADALRRVRLRHSVSRWIGDRWVHVSVKRRAADQAFEFGRTKRWPDAPKRWQAPGERESPREEWMSWRRSMTRYAYAGWMRFYHGKGPPLVGRANLYGPCPGPRASWMRPEHGTHVIHHRPFRPSF